jgi:beta-galactosidase/beta-glucuronidase
MTAEESYPRPTLKRNWWMSLNGVWDFALDHEAVWSLPEEVEWSTSILVPFSPETPASGIGDTGFYRAVWYRRTFDRPPIEPSEHLLINFGAVDYAATVWVNGKLAGAHEGGYTPFQIDITYLLTSDQAQTIVIRAEDDPQDLAKPRGKQDWQLESHSIWYPRTTGIWQTVWLEKVCSTWIDSIRWVPNVERWEIAVDVHLEGKRRDKLQLKATLRSGDNLLADDTYTVVAGEVHRRIVLSDPGIDDYRNELLWRPSQPTLIDCQLQLWGERGELLDEVSSYTALRAIGVQGDRFVLNGRPYPLRMVLDQGYWPNSGLTPPDDDALRLDIELVKSMGFNGVRKHQKIEDPRYLYWADKLGLLVWEEMPSAYRFTKTSIERLAREWTEVLDRDSSHPCIVAWVPFNESWGVPDLPDSPAQRHYVQALYHLTKTLDPTRPVVGNDGWESVATDIIGIHDYEGEPERLVRRYGADEGARLFKRERPGGRLLVLDKDLTPTNQPIMLTEFGGIAFSPKAGTWGYSQCETVEEFALMYAELMNAARSLPLLAGFCYTQFTDTYQEANGLLYADRTPKFPIEEIAMATRGAQSLRDRQIEWTWRQHLMNSQRSQYLVPVEDYRMQGDR